MALFARLIMLAAIALGTGAARAPAFVRDSVHQVPTTIGWVEIASAAQHADQLTIIGHVYATAPSAGRYTLVVARVGRGGTTNTQQAGTFSVQAGENKKLSTTSINLGKAEALKIELKLFSEGKEIFSVVMQPMLAKGQQDI
jgi:hypothetical protein